MGSLPRYQLALFDWNGTLLDDTEIWYGASCETFRAFGADPPTMEEYFRAMNGDYLLVYRERNIYASRKQLNAIYRKAYAERMHEAVLSPFAMITLLNLMGLGVRIGLVSTQLKSLVHPLIHSLPNKHFSINSLFCVTSCHVINKTSAIRRICKQLNVSRDRAFYVGDTPSDIRHANRAGITSIAFLNGHVPEDLFESASPDFSCTKLIDIRDCLKAGRRAS